MLKGIQIIVGLGNPGNEYTHTRHNAGAQWLGSLCQQYQIILKKQSKLQAHLGLTTINGQKYHILIPATYMNHSGQAVRNVANFYNIAPNAIMVVHDDLDLAPGVVRLKQGGGHGGHNGLRDIIAQLGSADFLRLRFGIGHPGDKYDVANFVLAAPTVAEEQQIQAAIAYSITNLDLILAGSLEQAKQKLHSFGSEENGV